ncbi:3766_t:CDS:1, partial [Gigaspora rosea]
MLAKHQNLTNSSSPSLLAYSFTLSIEDKNNKFKDEDDELEDAKSEDIYWLYV